MTGTYGIENIKRKSNRTCHTGSPTVAEWRNGEEVRRNKVNPHPKTVSFLSRDSSTSPPHKWVGFFFLSPTAKME